jgi:hypothetical protein
VYVYVDVCMYDMCAYVCATYVHTIYDASNVADGVYALYSMYDVL